MGFDSPQRLCSRRKLWDATDANNPACCFRPLGWARMWEVEGCAALRRNNVAHFLEVLRAIVSRDTPAWLVRRPAVMAIERRATVFSRDLGHMAGTTILQHAATHAPTVVVTQVNDREYRVGFHTIELSDDGQWLLYGGHGTLLDEFVWPCEAIAIALGESVTAMFLDAFSASHRPEVGEAALSLE